MSSTLIQKNKSNKIVVWSHTIIYTFINMNVEIYGVYAHFTTFNSQQSAQLFPHGEKERMWWHCRIKYSWSVNGKSIEYPSIVQSLVISFHGIESMRTDRWPFKSRPLSMVHFHRTFVFLHYLRSEERIVKLKYGIESCSTSCLRLYRLL